MNIETMVEIVESMAVEHAYPGFDIRSLHLGLPHAVINSHARLFSEALQQKSVLVKLAALRWFHERPGDAKRFAKQIAGLLSDSDEWVRLESVRTLGRIHNIPTEIALSVSKQLSDENVEVRKAACSSLAKIGCPNEDIIKALEQASSDSNMEVKWKAQKALRKLGNYSV